MSLETRAKQTAEDLDGHIKKALELFEKMVDAERAFSKLAYDLGMANRDIARAAGNLAYYEIRGIATESEYATADGEEDEAEARVTRWRALAIIEEKATQHAVEFELCRRAIGPLPRFF